MRSETRRNLDQVQELVFKVDAECLFIGSQAKYAATIAARALITATQKVGVTVQ